jgi:hypothetical protein
MKLTYITLILVLIAIRVFPQLPEFMWANQCGNPPNTSDTKTSVAPGADGQFYLSGEFLDTVNFGSKMLVSAGGSDVYLAKHSAGGVPEWSTRIGGTDDDYVQKVMTDNEGHVIVAGYFYGTIQIGQDQYSSFGSQDIFVARFNDSGELLWSYRAGGPMADYITGLYVDQDQNIAIGGYFYDSMDFGDTTLISSRSSDVYLAKLSHDGSLQWVTSAGGSSSDQAGSLSCDSNGNILLAGSFYYDMAFGDTILYTTNPVGVFIAKYNPEGQLNDVFQLNGTYLTTEVYIAACSNGDFYITGNFSEQLVFGNKTFDAGEFNQDIYLARYNASCELQWARSAFSYASDQVVDIATDSYNNVSLAGHYLDSIHFDLLTLPYTLCCGSREIFIVSYNAAGDVLWGDQITGTRSSFQAMAMNGDDELLLSGLFTEEVNFGPLKLSNFNDTRNYISCLQTEIYTSVKRLFSENTVNVFPNPAWDKISVQFETVNDDALYYIYQISGNQVKSGKLEVNGTIDVSGMPAGEYILRLTGQGEQTPSWCIFIKN